MIVTIRGIFLGYWTIPIRERERESPGGEKAPSKLDRGPETPRVERRGRVSRDGAVAPTLDSILSSISGSDFKIGRLYLSPPSCRIAIQEDTAAPDSPKQRFRSLPAAAVHRARLSIQLWQPARLQFSQEIGWLDEDSGQGRTLI